MTVIQKSNLSFFYSVLSFSTLIQKLLLKKKLGLAYSIYGYDSINF